jgi:hypothetical protein
MVPGNVELEKGWRGQRSENLVAKTNKTLYIFD